MADDDWEDVPTFQRGGGDGDGFVRQALPMEELPEDFDGNPQDGAQYLAMMSSMYKDLPFFKTVPKPKDNYIASFVAPKGNGVVTRHPALPKESWVETYSTHFMGYKKAVMAQPKHESTGITPPYGYHVSGFTAHIHGAKRKRIRVKEPVVLFDEAMDEEEAMANGLFAAPVAPAEEDEEEEEGEGGSIADTGLSSKFEFAGPEEPRHRPQEPLLSSLQSMNQTSMIGAIVLFNTWIREALESLEDPSPPLLPTQPSSTHTPAPPKSPCSLPFPPLYTRWMFALLLHLDPFLHPDDMSEVRALAKTCTDVVRWQARTGRLHEGEDPRQKEMQAGCWMVVYAVAEGWAQRDLVMDLERSFAGLPR